MELAAGRSWGLMNQHNSRASFKRIASSRMNAHYDQIANTGGF
jgi:hypothetical protein